MHGDGSKDREMSGPTPVSEKGREGDRSMKRLLRISAMACAVVFVGGAMAAAEADGLLRSLLASANSAQLQQQPEELRRILLFKPGTSDQAQKKIVTQSGAKLLRSLKLVNGAAIKLPEVGTEAALAYLQSHP